MKQVGFGVVDKNGKPTGIWPVSHRQATHYFARRQIGGYTGDEIVRVFAGDPVLPTKENPLATRPDQESAPA